MAGTSINCLAIVLKELGWSYTRLIAELRRQAAIDGVVLPKTGSLIRLISRWVNNHQQPDDFYRDLLSRATGRHRFELQGPPRAGLLAPPTAALTTPANSLRFPRPARARPRAAANPSVISSTENWRRAHWYTTSGVKRLARSMAWAPGARAPPRTMVERFSSRRRRRGSRSSG